jgi:hypothetical protein
MPAIFVEKRWFFEESTETTSCNLQKTGITSLQDANACDTELRVEQHAIKLTVASVLRSYRRMVLKSWSHVER